MSLLLAAGLGAAGSVISNVFNSRSQRKVNDRSENFAREMYGRERADSLSDWHMQNAYNDPSSQMFRLERAGLNPHLVYGNGADAQMGGPVRSSSASQPSYGVPKLDAAGVVMSALQAKQLQSNIARTDAETEAIRSRTAGTDFQNELNQRIGFEQMEAKYTYELNRLNTSQLKELNEYEILLNASGNPRDPNSPAAKAKRAGYDLAVQELQNARERGDVLASEAAIKKYEKRLTDQGFSSNSPFYLKAILSLLDKFGINVNDLNK